MNGLDQLNFQNEYHTFQDDLVKDFYIPCLERSVSYDRAVGFFSGITFQIVGKGLSQLIKNGGKMRLLVSTQLSKEDEEAISKGYDERKIIAQDILNKMDDPTDEFGKGYLCLLSYLISHDILDVKVAVVHSQSKHAILHEKLGLFRDLAGNCVAFSGSGNETPSGLMNNYEEFDVFCSWKGDDPSDRCFAKSVHFNQLWNGQAAIFGVDTIEFPDAVKAKIFQYQDFLPREQLEEIDHKYQQKVLESKLIESELPKLGDVHLFDYQNKAIANWKDAGYKGYFDMATGTGKTFTALGALVHLVHDGDIKTKRFFCVIVVPYQHLVTQWAVDCKSFFFDPILAFGNSKAWKEKFEDAVASIRLHQSKFEAVVITTDSLLHDFVLTGLTSILKNVVFIADEAHNLGAGKISQVLNIDFPFRLGLSATMERHHDDAGNQKLFNFFGKSCISYDLGRAIKEHHLSHYRYYPILVSLDEDELDQYIELSKKISKFSAYEDPDTSDHLKMLLIKRALVVAGAKAKIEALKKAIGPYKDDFYSLVYCGAVSYAGAVEAAEETQLKSVISMLWNDLGMTVSRFTAIETNNQRTQIKSDFQNKVINAIVAIRCLDEGVNIPCIQRAFILASSTNPKEYIQRRGRVLRLFNPTEKPYAEIYDFVTISRPLSEVTNLDQSKKKIESSIAKRELARVVEFSKLSDNSAESTTIINNIREAYGLDEFDPEEIDND
jgi:superfamily II DNA or RNA helicase